MTLRNENTADVMSQSLFRCRAGNRFIPPIEVTHSEQTRLTDIFNSFLISRSSGKNPNNLTQLTELYASNSKPASICLKRVNDNRLTQLDEYSAPKFRRNYSTKSPSICYDLASIRFNSMKGTTIWYSNRIANDSFYFNCLLHGAIAYAAATKGNGTLHGGFIKYKSNGFLMPGESCSGKSTLCLLAMFANGIAISDDMVILANSNNCFQARAFRSHFLARQNTFDLLPTAVQALCTPVITEFETKYRLSRKNISHLTELWGHINAIVVPQIERKESKKYQQPYCITNLPKSLAIEKIMASIDTTVMMPGLTQERISVTGNIVKMVTSLPCFKLTLRPTFLDNPIANMHSLMDELLQLVTKDESA